MSNDKMKNDPLADTDIFDGFAPVKHEGPIRGLRSNEVIVDEVPATPTPKADEETIWRASRKYCKTKKVSEQEARELMTNDPALCKEWANK